MSVFTELIEITKSLINEHGSATILRERLELLRDRIAENERLYNNLEAQNRQIKAELEQKQHQLRILEEENKRLKSSAPLAVDALCCGSCGSTALRRTGTRRSPGPFGDLGLKEAAYLCDDCHKETFIEIPIQG